MADHRAFVMFRVDLSLPAEDVFRIVRVEPPSGEDLNEITCEERWQSLYSSRLARSLEHYLESALWNFVLEYAGVLPESGMGMLEIGITEVAVDFIDL